MHTKTLNHRMIFYTMFLLTLLASGIAHPSNGVSALSYSSSTDAQFTFNPMISVSLSGDLIIDSLAPGSASDSNIITVGVQTNTSYGYSLTATTGTKTASADLVNSSNGNYKFTNLSTSVAGLPDFDDNNWGYSYSVDDGANWISGDISNAKSGYAGLPQDDNDASESLGHGGAILISTNNNSRNNQTVKFKIGAKASSTQVSGTYTNTVNFYAIANPMPFTVNFDANVGNDLGSVANLPESISTNDDTITLDSAPTRSGFIFQGWCDIPATIVSGAFNCTGATYAAGSTYPIVQTGSNYSSTLYAIWSLNCNPSGTNISSIVCMQDISDSNKSSVLSSMTQGSQYKLYDNRDQKPYYIARQADGNIWMTQNLDLCIGCTETTSLTSANTNLTTSGSGAYIDGYSTSSGVITWTPTDTAITTNRVASGEWGVYSTNAPYSHEGGDSYIYTSGTTDDDTVYDSMDTCVLDNHPVDNCMHYHIGNYYDWAASVASNDTSSLSDRAVANNSICPSGWRMPMGSDGNGQDSSYYEFGRLLYSSNAIDAVMSYNYTENGFNAVRTNPLYLVRGGSLMARSGVAIVTSLSNSAFYLTGVSGSGTMTVSDYSFNKTSSYTYGGYMRGVGMSIRCLVR